MEQQLRLHPEKWRNIDTRAFGEEFHRLVEKYDETAIVYDFTFTMTEANNLSAEINLFRALTAGSDALALKAANNRMRQNLRNFRITDTFGGLLVSPLTCPEMAPDPNYIYPVTGSIGLSEVIRTFVTLNEDQNLSEKEALQASDVFKDKVPRFADTLTFTTTISGSLGPKVVLNPVGKAFGLADAGLVAEANRTDVHAVVVALALPPPEAALALRRRLAGLPPKARYSPADVVAQREADYQIDKNRLVPLTRGVPTIFGPIQ